MRHLFNSVVEILRLEGTLVDGTLTQQWKPVGQMLCRIDLNFVRVGKDQPMPVAAGRAPDRSGLLFFSVGEDARAGDRLRCISGPVSGTFELRVVPDPAIGYSASHHLEAQIIEVSQQLAGRFPGSVPEQVVTP